MKKNIIRYQAFYVSVFFLLFYITTSTSANIINANSSNYTGFLSSLAAGDTLNLAPGTYVNNLVLNGRNGTPLQPIVITGNGNATNFQAQSCCNTVSITQCSFLVIKNFQLDGLNQNVDAVKAEGTIGNWAHHITIEYLNIINYGSNQQDVGISTKCSAWDWVIRKNKILGAGTGMYLGNSTGEAPFVNGIIEYNYVANTIGYNIEIKHQLDTVRDNFTGTSVNGKTIIRHNVFTKDTSSSVGVNARPNLLVGGFPLTGFGSADYYEIYGNFFYNNPVEALFQGTGNIMLYENIFVNQFDPSGFRAVYITPQNGVSPQDIKVFHNTALVLNSSGGIRLYNPNTNYQQYCYANAVFATAPITNFINMMDNITDTYANAGSYVLSASMNIATLNLYPQTGQLTGSLTPDTLFTANTYFDRDFNGDIFDWTYRGAYSGCCTNNGWQLQYDTMPTLSSTITSIDQKTYNSCSDIFPNPVTGLLYIKNKSINTSKVDVYNLSGELIYTTIINSDLPGIDLRDKPAGIYLLIVKRGDKSYNYKFIKQ